MGTGSPQSVAAGAVIGVFALMAVLLKLAHTLYKCRATSAVAPQHVGPKGDSSHLRESTITQEIAPADCVEKTLEEGSVSAPQAVTSELRSDDKAEYRALLSVGRPQTPVRPQTPADFLALKHAANVPTRSAVERYSMGAAQRPRSAESLERPGSPSDWSVRPTSSCSTRSAWSDDRREDPSRPWSTPSEQMVQSEWWVDAREWWPESVADRWESPYRPTPQNSERSRSGTPMYMKKRRPQNARSFSAGPKLQSTWPNKLPQPVTEVYSACLWSNWATDEPAPRFTDSTSRFTANWEDGNAFDEPYITVTRAAPSPTPKDCGDLPCDPPSRTAPMAEKQPVQPPPPPLPPGFAPTNAAAEHSSARPSMRPSTPGVRFVPQGPASKGTGQPKWHGFLGFMSAGKGKQEKPQVESRASMMLKQLEETRGTSFSERKRIFRELQRQLHPDKNVDCEEEAKLAFQELMQQRASYLSS